MKTQNGFPFYLLITLLTIILKNNQIIKTSIIPRKLQNSAYNTELTSEAVFELNNLHDNLFAIKVKIGSPSQTLNLIIDISSEFSFLKVPKCLDTSCDENFEKNENIFNYDPNASNSKKLVQKDSVFSYNNVKYEADILKDIFSFPVSADFENPEDKNNLIGNFLVLDDFSFFLVDENINLDADGVLGLNPFLASNKYSEFSFIESAKNKGFISEQAFALNYVDKHHAKLFLGKNNFEKEMQIMHNSLNVDNNYNNNNNYENSISGNFINNKNSNSYSNNNNNYYYPNNQNKNSDNSSKEANQDTSYNTNSIGKTSNYAVSTCKINPVKSNQSLTHFQANNKQITAKTQKSLISPLYSWNCKTSHLLLGEENNFYSAVAFEAQADKADKTDKKAEVNISLANNAINVEFSTCLKNIIIDIRFLNLFLEKYAKKITPFCVVKNEKKVSYIDCEKKHLDSSVIPSLNFIFNGFSYKILAKDLFEHIYGDSDNLYYRLRIAFTETPENKWFFGYIFLKNNLVEFNKQKNSIVFYEGIKHDLSKLISDTKETFCFYNFLNYVFIIVLVLLCMFYIYNREKKKNQIIEIPFFLKKNYSELTSEKDLNSDTDKNKKDSMISNKSNYLFTDRESEIQNKNLKHASSSNSLSLIAPEKNFVSGKENFKNKSENNLAVIAEEKNDRIIEVKEYDLNTYSDRYFGEEKASDDYRVVKEVPFSFKK